MQASDGVGMGVATGKHVMVWQWVWLQVSVSVWGTLTSCCSLQGNSAGGRSAWSSCMGRAAPVWEREPLVRGGNH